MENLINPTLALGSNLGDRLGVLRAAVAALAPFFTVTAVSPVYETPPAYITNQPAFLNMAVAGETELAAPDLLRALKNIERQLGRLTTVRNGPRLIDIDIIFYGDLVVGSEALNIPHPALAEREFVLRPLADIAPDLRHPVTDLTVAEMLARVPSSGAVRFGSL